MPLVLVLVIEIRNSRLFRIAFGLMGKMPTFHLAGRQVQEMTAQAPPGSLSPQLQPLLECESAGGSGWDVGSLQAPGGGFSGVVLAIYSHPPPAVHCLPLPRGASTRLSSAWASTPKENQSSGLATGGGLGQTQREPLCRPAGLPTGFQGGGRSCFFQGTGREAWSPLAPLL